MRQATNAFFYRCVSGLYIQNRSGGKDGTRNGEVEYCIVILGIKTKHQMHIVSPSTINGEMEWCFEQVL